MGYFKSAPTWDAGVTMAALPATPTPWFTFKVKNNVSF